MRVATIVGARPQFIKAAPLCRALAEAGHEELLIHTGQHYDFEMSEVFFRELPIPKPKLNLEVGSGSPSEQVAQVLMRVEAAIAAESLDWVVVFGDTNSTLGGALAANKVGVPLAHVEAGLRSFNRGMPEEHNRVLTDHVADLLLCPTRTAVENLLREGLRDGVHQVGDTMLDAVQQFSAVACERSRKLDELGLEPGGFLLATVHRNYNTDDPDALRRILETLADLGTPVVFPVHPRTRKEIERLTGAPSLDDASGLRAIDPVSYLDMLALEATARAVVTDSGGMQKEAFFLGVPCLTLRPETEWVETVESGWNTLVGSDPARIRAAVAALHAPDAGARSATPAAAIFGDGRASEAIVALLEDGARA